MSHIKGRMRVKLDLRLLHTSAIPLALVLHVRLVIQGDTLAVYHVLVLMLMVLRVPSIPCLRVDELAIWGSVGNIWLKLATTIVELLGS